MLTRQKYIDEVIESLNILRQEITSKSKLNLTDGNIHIEKFLCGLLNICYGYNLINLNKEIMNYPGIDLGDEELKLGFQVTSTKTSTKINDTLRKFIDNKCYEKYKSIKFFIVTEKQDSYKISVDYSDKVIFNWEEDIIDFDDLFFHLNDKDTDILKDVHTYVNREVTNVFNSFYKKIDVISKAYIRLFKADFVTVIDNLKMIQKTNSIYNESLSKLEEWQEKYTKISYSLNEEESNTLIHFYSKLEELKGIAEHATEYLNKTYKQYRPGLSIADAIFSRYAQAFHGIINEILELNYSPLIEKLTKLSE